MRRCVCDSGSNPSAFVQVARAFGDFMFKRGPEKKPQEYSVRHMHTHIHPHPHPISLFASQ